MVAPKKRAALYPAAHLVADTMRQLADLADAIEEDRADLTPTIIALFKALHSQGRENVDRTILALDLVEAQFIQFKQRRDYYGTRAARLEEAWEAAKAHLCEAIDRSGDVLWEGDLGRLATQNNSNAALKVNLCDDTGRNVVSSDDKISAGDLFVCDIPEQFVERVEFYRLRNDEIRKALDAGETIKWATLVRGRHMRIRRGTGPTPAIEAEAK